MLLVARDRETARALGHEFACHEVSKLYLAAGYDVSFSSSHLPRVGIVYSDIVSVCDAKRMYEQDASHFYHAVNSRVKPLPTSVFPDHVETSVATPAATGYAPSSM